MTATKIFLSILLSAYSGLAAASVGTTAQKVTYASRTLEKIASDRGYKLQLDSLNIYSSKSICAGLNCISDAMDAVFDTGECDAEVVEFILEKASEGRKAERYKGYTYLFSCTDDIGGYLNNLGARGRDAMSNRGFEMYFENSTNVFRSSIKTAKELDLNLEKLSN